MLSHGQASVERGFSINKEISCENMKQKTLSALRIISNHLSSVGGASQVKITKELLASVATAKSKYNAYLDEQKREKAKITADLKRKAELDELESLKSKKSKLEICARELSKSAEKFSEKAEKTQNFTLIAKSNALRRSAKLKSVEISVLEEQISQKQQEIKKLTLRVKKQNKLC